MLYKITIEQKEAIRNARKAGVTLSELANKYGVSIVTILHHTKDIPNPNKELQWINSHISALKRRGYTVIPPKGKL